MSPRGSIDQFEAISLSIATHPFDTLVLYPDSRTFYEQAAGKTLPTAIQSFVYTATCNRVEIYIEKTAGAKDDEVRAAIENFAACFAAFYTHKPEIHAGAKSLEHVIAVASGLKSIALGETQIAGQLKRDLAYAESRSWVTPAMRTFLQKAQETQKLIRNQTGISRHAYSLMSLVGREASARGLSGFDGNGGIILVGASEMSAKVARFALKRNMNFLIVRKDLTRAMNAEMQSLIQAHPENFSQITLAEFRQADFAFTANAIVLASSNAEPFIDAGLIAKLEASNRLSANAAIVDLALPGNTTADVATTYPKRFISLNSLKKISEAAIAERVASSAEAEPLIRRAVYQLWLDLLYRENPRVVQSYLNDKRSESENEWQRLSSEAALNEKQKRIMYDFIKKEQRRALASHREMILDLIAGQTQRFGQT